MFRKEVDRPVLICVTEEANDSEWGAPYFAHTKPKTNRIRFLSDIRNLNRQLKRNPYTMPKIRKILLNFEGFQQDTSLDLNIDYCRIRLIKEASN